MMRHATIFFFCWIVGTLESYQMGKLTVLTGPIGTQSSTQYSGHPAVTRSLIMGLRRIKAPFNYNPRSLSEVGDVVYIVAGNADVIKHALALKRQGRIKKLLIGPNAFDLFKPGNIYAQNKLVDLRINPSNWIRDTHLIRYPDLCVADFLVWPAGVDENFFKPVRVNTYTSKKVLVYNKRQDVLAKQVAQILRTYQFEPIIITFGSYSAHQYKAALSDVSFAVFLTKTESQGLALAECWAMDVPTLCWNMREPHHYLGINYPVSSACPYLTNKTGFAWQTFDELNILLEKNRQLFAVCAPRAWVLEHMTDSVVAQKLLDAIAQLD